jgi:Reverse transcriptase (RNA-dependent DNA polymerase)
LSASQIESERRTPALISHFSFCLCLFMHAIRDNFTTDTVIPIPKGKNTNLTDSNNYRRITLSSIFGKIFYIIFINKHYDDLSTSELQFGLKKKRSMNHCSMVLKETIAYYVQQDSMVYCTMLDVTKAFDRVQYCKLFRLLVDRKLTAVWVRLLANMYMNSSTPIAWNRICSATFPVF